VASAGTAARLAAGVSLRSTEPPGSSASPDATLAGPVRLLSVPSSPRPAPSKATSHTSLAPPVQAKPQEASHVMIILFNGHTGLAGALRFDQNAVSRGNKRVRALPGARRRWLRLPRPAGPPRPALHAYQH